MTGQYPRSDERSADRIERTATEARGAEIILDQRGRWICACSSVLMVIVFVSIALWW